MKTPKVQSEVQLQQADRCMNGVACRDWLRSFLAVRSRESEMYLTSIMIGQSCLSVHILLRGPRLALK
jgi:hypothetical protein